MQSLHLAELETAHARDGYTVGRWAGKQYMATPHGAQGAAQAQDRLPTGGLQPGKPADAPQ